MVTEVRLDPEFAALRKGVRYHRLIARFEAQNLVKPPEMDAGKRG